MNSNDTEANTLINILKLVFKYYNVSLIPGTKDVIFLHDEDEKYEFAIHYEISERRPDKLHIHLRESKQNINLFRVNIDPNGFHNNFDEKVIGNRMLIFSQKEWYEKNDGSTNMRAYPLPEEHFPDTQSFVNVFVCFLEYTNVKEEGKLNVL